MVDAAVARNEVIEPSSFMKIFGIKEDVVDAAVARNEVVEPVTLAILKLQKKWWTLLDLNQ